MKSHSVEQQSLARRASAFTLIELLIVVAIIAILAAIAVPNFIEAQVRAKVARTLADMRSLATGIESYTVDNNKPPVRREKWDVPNSTPRFAPRADEKMYDPNNLSAAVGMKVITTPIAYISVIPPDIFNLPLRPKIQPDTAYSDALDYWDPTQVDAFLPYINGLLGLNANKAKGRGWMLVSVGPDQYLGLFMGLLPDYPAETVQLANTARYYYDPTNGSVSMGNLMRFSSPQGQERIYQIK